MLARNRLTWLGGGEGQKEGRRSRSGISRLMRRGKGPRGPAGALSEAQKAPAGLLIAIAVNNLAGQRVHGCIGERSLRWKGKRSSAAPTEN